jgi:hypothetical protein
MGFKITSNKSWKSLGKAEYYKKTTDVAAAEVVDGDNYEVSKKQEKKNNKGTSDFFNGFTKEKNYNIVKDVGNDSKKTFNAASAGIGRAAGGLNETMSNAILIGVLGLGAIIIIPSMFGGSKKSE